MHAKDARIAKCARNASKPALETCRPGVDANEKAHSRLRISPSDWAPWETRRQAKLPLRASSASLELASSARHPLARERLRIVISGTRDRIVWQTVCDFANGLFHNVVSVLNFAKPTHRDSQFANNPTAKPLLRLPFRHRRAIWHAPKTHPRTVRENGCFSRVGNARGRFRGRRAARHFRTHPTFHRSSWLLLSPPTSSLALTLSSSACRARSPTRTPVRTSRAARVAKRKISHDTTAAETARPGATRRARRFRRPRADIQPLPVAFPGPLPRARTSRPRATSRCVPSSCAFFEIFGDARGHERKRDARSAPDVARVRVARAREPPRARRAIDPGHGRTRSSRFRSVPTRVPPHPRHRRLVRTRHPGQASTRHSNKWRQRGFRITNAPGWRTPLLPLRAVFLCFFVSFRKRRSIDRSNDRSIDERALDLVAHLHDLPRSPRPHHVTPKDPRCGRCSLHRQGG